MSKKTTTCAVRATQKLQIDGKVCLSPVACCWPPPQEVFGGWGGNAGDASTRLPQLLRGVSGRKSSFFLT
jgi:hypothetical protein